MWPVPAREAYVIGPAAHRAQIDRLLAGLEAQGGWRVDRWPVLRPPGWHAALYMRRIIKARAGDAGSAFEAGYDAALSRLEIPRSHAQAVQELEAAILAAAEAVAASKLGAEVGLSRAMMVGSTSRGTYIGLPVDFDLAFLTAGELEEFDHDLARKVCDAIAGRLAQSPALGAYLRLLAPRVSLPASIELRSFGIRGKRSLVGRYDAILPGTPAERVLLLDVTFGMLPQLIGYEIWIQRFLAALPLELAERVRAEMRLAKSVLRGFPDLYGSSRGGLRAHCIEQLVIQGANYRSSGHMVGTFDNALRLIFEEGQDAASEAAAPFETFKRRFPLWHPGWWETEVGLEPCARNVDLWDFLGDGEPRAAEQRWQQLFALARRHVGLVQAGADWTVERLVGP
jgi:hypothetical protein